MFFKSMISLQEFNKQRKKENGFTSLSTFKNTAPQEEESLWRKTGNVLTRPISVATNLLEGTGKAIAAPIAKAIKPELSLKEMESQVLRETGEALKGSLTGKNLRTPSDIASDQVKYNKEHGQGNSVLDAFTKVTGYGGDFLLDPLNKLKVLSLTDKGVEAMKTGSLGLSMAERAARNEQALVEFAGVKVNGKVVLNALTKANDLLRETKGGAAVIDTLSKFKGSIRPSGVTREEWAVMRNAIFTAKNTIDKAKTDAITFAVAIGNELRKNKVTVEQTGDLLHAIEKGKRELAPAGLEDIFNKAYNFKVQNEALWKKLGGSIIEDYGMSHVGTKALEQAARQEALNKTAFHVFSPNTPLDLHREWVRIVDGMPGQKGKIVSLKEQGITYVKDVLEQGKHSYVGPEGQLVKIEQASAKEINDYLARVAGKQPIFEESLPVVIAKMGIATGKKQAGIEFLHEVNKFKQLSPEAEKLAMKTYEKFAGRESISKALSYFDKVQGVWKAQALVAPSYHLRNMVGNLWNNYLANVSPADYGRASALQKRMRFGTLTKEDEMLVSGMEKQGVIGGGWYGADIPQTVENEISKGTWNPFSQTFKGYRANKAIGEALENNARIAHYMTRVREGFSPKEAAKSVKQYLFDYGDLTDLERGVLKRFLPFYTWTSKNVPLQVKALFNEPGKFSKLALGQRDIENEIPKPDERYFNSYIQDNTPLRIRKNKDGSADYLLLGAWLPAASAFQVLSQPIDSLVSLLSPFLKVPAETYFNRSSFFRDTNGEMEKLENTYKESQNFLGVDMRKKYTNILRSIRVLNEIDKLNPGELWGSKEKDSVWSRMGLPVGSEKRGGRYSPDTTFSSRLLQFLVGKTSNYNPKNAKMFYDYDTEDRVGEIKQAIKKAQRDNQKGREESLKKELEEYLKIRKK